MKRTQITITRGDETAIYAVTGYNAKTVGEFVNEVLSEYPKEWGSFEVNNLLLNYRYGLIIDDIPLNVKDMRIKKIEAEGGWSRMDYTILTE